MTEPLVSAPRVISREPVTYTEASPAKLSRVS
jgi:hypothetical protein